MNRPQPPLWRQLIASAQVLTQIHTGASATAALAQVAPPLRPGVQALVFDGLREWGLGVALMGLLCKREPVPEVKSLLALSLILLSGQAQSQYNSHTLVDQTIESAKRLAAARNATGFLNATLRNFLREKDQWMKQALDKPLAAYNHPQWWIERLQHEYPMCWASILKANNQPGPLTLRINPRQVTRTAYLQALSNLGIQAVPIGDSGVKLDRAHDVQTLPGYAQGWFSVQDAAAQIAAPLLLSTLAHSAESRLLDACAAPGGKTAHLLEISEAQVTALEIDEERSRKISENLNRLHLKADIQVADASQRGWWNGTMFDGILLDAPCTASGIVRRHPDVRWLRRASDIDQLAQTQRQLLDNLWPLLKPGGALLYCTCSVFKSEGQDQIEAFLARNNNSALLPSPGHLIPTLNGIAQTLNENAGHDHDGFFYALLRKAP